MVTTDRFWSKALIVDPEACWEWQAGREAAGYGNYWDGARNNRAHVHAYRLGVGPIPKGMHVHHRCGNRGCVNPMHLEALTRRDHVQLHDTIAPIAAANRAKTHCAKGHAYTPENTRVYRGMRKCRECDRQYKLERRSR